MSGLALAQMNDKGNDMTVKYNKGGMMGRGMMGSNTKSSNDNTSAPEADADEHASHHPQQ